ncbi:MAG: DUF167 domain-containing protein [Chloroflexi bacterium]|nr:DUF167 domain-containing protein [Chloroflexota bacterium]MCI0855356.1 DUF167 domain-containing protein [Chloroflexota bacterium]MCI0889475.1 DUF167 domain-containing protein [Chloroflexota bacterium]
MRYYRATVRAATAHIATGAGLEARIRVRLTPRSARNEITGWRDGLLRVRVTAPPVDGKANAALEQLVANTLGVRKSAVSVVSGARGREKTITIEGYSKDEVHDLLGRADT